MKTIIEKILKTKIGTTFEHEVRENGSENFKLITYGKGITVNIGKTREKFPDKTFVGIYLFGKINFYIVEFEATDGFEKTIIETIKFIIRLQKDGQI